MQLCCRTDRLVMAGGRGAAEIGSGENRRKTGNLRQLLGAEQTEEAVVFKPQTQTTHKQSQVGYLTVSVSGWPKRHAGMLAMQMCLCNRSPLSLPAVFQH